MLRTKLFSVTPVHCRGTVRRFMMAMSVSCLVMTAACVPWAEAHGSSRPHGSTNTVSATQAQVFAIEQSIVKENQRSEALSQAYDKALGKKALADIALHSTQQKLATLHGELERTSSLLATDAVSTYVNGSSGNPDIPSGPSSANEIVTQGLYQQTVANNLAALAAALVNERNTMSKLYARQRQQARHADKSAAQVKQLVAENAAATAQQTATLREVQGRLAQEVAAAAVAEAKAEAAAAAAARSKAAAEAAAAAAAAAAGVASSVGGSSAASAAAGAANSAAGSAGGVTQVSGTGVASGSAAVAVGAAVSQLGVKYVWGGESPGVGFDCSGLTQWSWETAGVGIPRTAAEQWDSITHVSLTDLRPGDLLFYYNLDNDHQVDHVVMYVGSGPYGDQTIVQAPHTGAKVSYSPVWTYDLIGAGQP